MPDNPIFDSGERQINDAISIDTKRIYDSCVSKDCLEDLRVTFFNRSQRLIDDAVTIKCRDCEIVSVSIDVDEVPFNRGYYGVDITFYFRLTFDIRQSDSPSSAKSAYFTVPTEMLRCSPQALPQRNWTAPKPLNTQIPLLRFRQLIPSFYQPILLTPANVLYRFAHHSRSPY